MLLLPARISLFSGQIMVVSVTLNPSIDRTLMAPDFSTGKVCRGEIVNVAAGGKGINVSRAVKCFGGETLALMVTGGETGEFIGKKLFLENIPQSTLRIRGESRICYGIIDKVLNKETVLNESGPEVSADEVSGFKELFSKSIKENDIIALSGSAAKGFDNDIYFDLIEISRKKRAKIILDSSGELLIEAVKAKPYIIKINNKEMEKLTNRDLYDFKEIKETALELTKTGVYMVVVTQGAGDVIAVTGERSLILTPPSVECVNSWGSGDSVTAGLAYCLAENTGFEETLRFAVAAGTANTLSYGAGHMDQSEVFALTEMVKVTEQ